VASGDTVRLGGYAPVAGHLDGEAVLARLILRPREIEPRAIGVIRALVVTAAGAPYGVTAGGSPVSPGPWPPRLLFPLLQRLHDL
jgi:hypothetical protein